MKRQQQKQKTAPQIFPQKLPKILVILDLGVKMSHNNCDSHVVFVRNQFIVCNIILYRKTQHPKQQQKPLRKI
jgi:hypothetical protein